MENKKDTDISQNIQDSKNLIVFHMFEKDNYLLFIYKKAERIVSAFYLVSNLFHDSEPIKWQFRGVGIGIISKTLSLTLNPLSKSEVLSGLTADLVTLLSLLDVSFVTGIVSEMNFTLLKKELELLLETLNPRGYSRSARGGKKGLFNKEFFAVPAGHLGSDFGVGASLPSSAVSFPDNDSDSSDKPLYTWSDVNRLQHETYKRHSKGQKISDSGKISKPVLAGEKNFKGQAMSGVARQTAIVEMLKAKNELTIKDFTPVIKGCSEKTIQRELLKLVRFGVLKKEGERRWSRYSLVAR